MMRYKSKCLEMTLSRMIARTYNLVQSRCGKIRSLIHNKDGASAIEFAFIAPMLIASIAVAGMFGILAKQRMDINQVVQAGVAAAMDNPGVPAVVKRMTYMAGEKGYVVSDWPNGQEYDKLIFVVAQVCFCPNDPNWSVDCSGICTGPVGPRPVGVLYDISAVYIDSLIARCQMLATRLFGYSVNASNVQTRTQVIVR